MNHLRYLIFLITLQGSLSEWTITHYEGYEHSFTQHPQDNGILIECKAYNFPIFAQQNKLAKVVSLTNNRSFNATKILIEYIVPTDQNVIVTIQNKQINQFDISSSLYGKSMLNQCFNTSNYQMLTLEHEIVGKNFTEISINLSLGENEQTRYIVFQIKCPEYCNSCTSDFGFSKCNKCEKGYEPSQDRCICKTVVYEDKCVQQCPDYYQPDQTYTCIKAKKLESKVAYDKGFFLNKLHINEKLEESIQLTQSTDFYLKFDLLLNNFKILQQLNIIVNDQFSGVLAQYHDLLVIGLIKNDEQNCQYQKDCRFVTLQTPIISINSSKLKIQLIYKKVDIKQKQEFIEEIDSSLEIKAFEIVQLDIEKKKCKKENCQSCLSKDNVIEECKKCNNGYYVYEGECVQNCPKTTFINSLGVCEDFIAKFQNSAYAIKDLSIQSYDSLGMVSFKNSESSLYYRFNQTVLLFGGNWKNQEYTKIMVLQPHYALTYAFTLTFIDFDRQCNKTGFYYQIDGGEKYLITPENEIQIDGDAQLPDSIVHFTKYFKHQNDDLMLTIGCDAQSYCFLSNYYFIVHQCAPYCKICTGPNKTDCVEFYSNSPEFNAKTQQCNRGYFEDEKNYCQQCEVRGCLECSSKNICLVCKKQCTIKLQGQICECQ